MNKYIVFGLGLGIGAAIGGYFGYKKAMKKAQAIADEQVEDVKKSLKAYYENKAKNEEAKQAIEDLGVNPGINDEPVEDSRNRFQRSSEAVQSNNSRVVQNFKDETDKIARDYLSKVDKTPDAVDTFDGYPDPDDKKAPPYLIREEDYGELDNWDTLDLILWKCGTVTMNDSMCYEVQPSLLFKLLPENWANMFGWDAKGKYADTVCFRNNKERRDIQIVKDNRTYREWVEEVYPGRLSEFDDE